LTSSESQSSGSVSQKSGGESALIRAEYDRVVSNRETVEKWVRRAGLFENRAVADGINDSAKQAARAFECADKKDFDKAREHLEQSDEQTHKALYGAVASIGGGIQAYENDLKHANLNEHFGHYQALSGVFIRIKRQIEGSRQNREQRDGVFRDIAAGADFEALLNYFDELKGSSFAIGKSIEKKSAESRELRVQWAVGISLTLFSVAAGAALTIIIA